jgi:hypothetical protein
MEEAISLLTETGTMNPDHPMLQRAQQALANQLNAKRMRVEGELREKQNALTVRLVLCIYLQNITQPL